MASLDKARIDELAQNLNRLLVTLDATARDARMAELSAQTSATLVELRRLITDTRTIVERGEIDQTLRQLNTASGRLAALLDDPAFRTVPRDAAVIAEQLRQLSTSGELQRLAAQADAAATRANQILGSNEYDLRVAVEDLRASLENLRQLTETLRADPAALLFAPPPRPVVLPGAPR
jgi:ABC-type transporter Mla subunit MlaD